MTNAMRYDYREPTLADYARFPVLRELRANKFYPKIIQMYIQQEAPDTNFTEIMVNYTAIFDGTSTAAVVYYDSSDAGDTAAGVGIRTITIFGVDEAGTDYQEITDSMAGQTGTATAEKWQRLVAFEAATCGANGDAEGTVTIQDDAAGTNKHMTIAAGDTGSISARIYLPSSWKGWMHYIRAQVAEAAHATDAFTDQDGFLFRPIWQENTGRVSDGELAFACSTNTGPVELWDVTPIIESNSCDNYISLQHVTKQADANAIAMYEIVYIVYSTSTTQRGV